MSWSDNRYIQIAMSQVKQDTYCERMTNEFSRLLRKLSKPKKSFAERNLWVFYLGFLFNIAAISIYALIMFKNNAYWNTVYIVIHYLFLGQMIWSYQKYKLNQREEVANAI